MDKILDRKSFEVGVHWSLWRGWKKTTMQNRQKSNAKKINSQVTQGNLSPYDNHVVV